MAVTPLQLITAISAVANGGKLMRPYIISQITDSEGNVVDSTQPEVVGNPITEETSALMRSLLTDVVEYGGGKNARIAGIKVAGKTGTRADLQGRRDIQGRAYRLVHRVRAGGLA